MHAKAIVQYLAEASTARELERRTEEMLDSPGMDKYPRNELPFLYKWLIRRHSRLEIIQGGDSCV